MTPLQRAQAFARDNADLHTEIVNSLRCRGWSREGAIEEADAKLARMLEREEMERPDG